MPARPRRPKDDGAIPDALPLPTARGGKVIDDPLAEIDRMARMGSRGKFQFVLPNGGAVTCANSFEHEEVRRNAQPYIEAQDEISSDAWIDVVNLLNTALNLYVCNKKLTDLRIREQEITNDDDYDEFIKRYGGLSERLVKQITLFQDKFNEIRLKLDQLRSKAKAESLTLADFVEQTKTGCTDYAKTHLGEYVWMTSCPNPDCRHFKKPFVCLQQAPHFAYDFSIDPYAIWNSDIYFLTFKRYLDKKYWGAIEKSYYSDGLSFSDAARILRIAPIGWLGAIYERQKLGVLPDDREFPLDLEKIINNVGLLSKYSEEPVVEDGPLVAGVA